MGQTKLSFARKQQAKIMAAIKSRKRYVPYHHMASLATIGRKQPCYCTSCNYSTKQKYHFDKHDIDTSHEESLQTWNTEPKETNDKEIREITEKTYNNKKGHSNIEYYNSTINIEYPNTNDSIDTYDNDNLDIIPIQWNLTELSNSDHYEAAIIKIQRRVPFRYRHSLISLLGTIYQSGTDYEIQIEIRDKFQDIGHWILSKYNRLLKNKNTRQHLQNKLRKEEYDLVSKTNDQENEVKQIAGAGRIIYDIFIHCQFIPIEYLCLLATILDNGISYQYISSSVILPYTYSTYDENIDLILNTGAFYITTKEIKNDTIINIETNKNIEDTGPQTININPKYDTQIHHMKTHTSEKDIRINDITENENIQTQLSKDDLIMQVTLQNSFNTLKEENRNTGKISQDESFNNYRQTQDGTVMVSPQGHPLCNYCGIPSHKREMCRIKKADREAGLTRTIHPDRDNPKQKIPKLIPNKITTAEAIVSAATNPLAWPGYPNYPMVPWNYAHPHINDPGQQIQRGPNIQALVHAARLENEQSSQGHATYDPQNTQQPTTTPELIHPNPCPYPTCSAILQDPQTTQEHIRTFHRQSNNLAIKSGNNP